VVYVPSQWRAHDNSATQRGSERGRHCRRAAGARTLRLTRGSMGRSGLLRARLGSLSLTWRLLCPTDLGEERASGEDEGEFPNLNAHHRRQGLIPKSCSGTRAFPVPKSVKNPKWRTRVIQVDSCLCRTANASRACRDTGAGLHLTVP
jgi:hypothetical protein